MTGCPKHEATDGTISQAKSLPEGILKRLLRSEKNHGIGISDAGSIPAASTTKNHNSETGCGFIFVVRGSKGFVSTSKKLQFGNELWFVFYKMIKETIFNKIKEALVNVVQWRSHYNMERPHGSLG